MMLFTSEVLLLVLIWFYNVFILLVSTWMKLCARDQYEIYRNNSGLHVQPLPDLFCAREIYIYLHRFTRLLRPKYQLFNTQRLINKTMPTSAIKY